MRRSAAHDRARRGDGSGAAAPAPHPDDLHRLHRRRLRRWRWRTGAGAGSQNDIGTGVIGGMITATVLAIFFVPVFYEIVRERFKGRANPEQLPPSHSLPPSSA